MAEAGKQKLEAMVDPFADLTSKSPGREEKVQFDSDEKVVRMLDCYSQFARNPEHYAERARDDIKYIEFECLDPAQIGKFTSVVLEQLATGEYSRHLGQFLRPLIMASYKAGHNDFTLQTGDREISHLGIIQGTKENPLKLSVVGNTGFGFAFEALNCIISLKGNGQFDLGLRSKQCIFDIAGNVGDSFASCSTGCVYNVEGNALRALGDHSENSVFNIKGDVEHNLGLGAAGCRFNVHGNIGKCCGNESVRCEYVIEGSAGDLINDFSDSHAKYTAENCVFKVARKDVYEMLKKQLPEGNRVEMLK